MDIKIKELSDLIASKAVREAAFFPVDRYFLAPYIKQILQFNKTEFLLYNFELVNPTYSVQLMACLPELWQYVDINDIINVVNGFTNEFSFYAIIEFTYKYVGINIIELILKLNSIKNETKNNIKEFLAKSFYPNLLMTESDLFFFDNEVYGVSRKTWKDIKQRLLLDKRVKPTLDSLDELQNYVHILDLDP